MEGPPEAETKGPDSAANVGIEVRTGTEKLVETVSGSVEGAVRESAETGVGATEDAAKTAAEAVEGIVKGLVSPSEKP